MRAAVPVIASNVGGLSEIVDNGVAGVLVPSDDADALVEVLRNHSDAQLRAMGRAGKERFVREFTMDRTHRELCEVYAQQRLEASSPPLDAFDRL